MAKSNLVIRGGGFAGTTFARRLERRRPEDWQLIMLSQENCITYNPLLAEVVGASMLPGRAHLPLDPNSPAALDWQSAARFVTSGKLTSGKCWRKLSATNWFLPDTLDRERYRAPRADARSGHPTV